jgi:hypothetical protein
MAGKRAAKLTAEQRRNLKRDSLEYHAGNFPGNGKIEVVSKCPVRTFHQLSMAYTPGVAEPCREIFKESSKVFDYTTKANMVAVVTDGTAVLRLEAESETYTLRASAELNACSADREYSEFGALVENGSWYLLDDLSVRFIIEEEGVEKGRITYDFTGSIAAMVLCRPRDEEGQASKLLPVRYPKLR